jgi:hypothetical protein
MKAMSRQEILKGVLRSGALAGVVGLGVVLNTRDEKFECSNRCGTCPELENGKCGLGIK